jgi:hypothetical protein
MGDTPLSDHHEQLEQLHHDAKAAVAASRRLMRPTLAETERIARDCPAEGLALELAATTVSDPWQARRQDRR